MRRTVTKKLIKSGKSVAVVLPMWWIKLNGLGSGGEIAMEIGKDSVKIKPFKGAKNAV